MKQALTAAVIALITSSAHAQLYEPIQPISGLEPINPGVYDNLYGQQPNYTGQFGVGRSYPRPRGSLGLIPRPSSSNGLIQHNPYGCSGLLCD